MDRPREFGRSSLFGDQDNRKEFRMNNDARVRLGNRIRWAREAGGWTQAELGKMLKYKTGNFVMLIESGNADIPPKKIPLLSEILGLDPRALLKEVLSVRYPELAKYL
jgi:transcriptional regulator with XRE-family HTH domain